MEPAVRRKLSAHLSMAKALRTSMDTALANAQDEVWKHAGFRQFARKYNEIVQAVRPLIQLTAPLDFFMLDKMPGLGDSVTVQQKEYFENVHANLSIFIAWLEEEIGVIHDEVDALRDFIQARLRAGVHVLPEKEEQVQDALETLLIGRGMQKGIDYDREYGRTKVSVKQSTPDFIFPRLSLALEVKLLKEKPRLGPTVDQINADIRSYGTGYSRLLFVVYDLGAIQNETEFRTGLEKRGEIAVVVVKH